MSRFQRFVETVRAYLANEEPRFKAPMNTERIKLFGLIETANAKREAAEKNLANCHHVCCNYRHGPIGGYGCICVVKTKQEVASMQTAWFTTDGAQPRHVAVELDIDYEDQ